MNIVAQRAGRRDGTMTLGALDPLLVETRIRSGELCAAADVAIRKGDVDLAWRLLIQADIDDPRSRSAQERLTWLAHQAAARACAASAPASAGRKFDFLYAPTLRGLSTELSSLLPLHPDIVTVPKHELDNAIEGRAEPALLAKYQRQSLDRGARLKAGLVQHAFIAGQLAGPDVAERLAAVTTRRQFVHGVRDPAQLVVSDFNHELIARHGGAYFFWPVYARTPFGRTCYVLANGSNKYVWTARRRARLLTERFAARRAWKLPIAADHVAERLESAMSRPRHFAVGQTYAAHFDSWLPVDLERPADPQHSVINRVFRAVGVDDGFRHPAFRTSEGTRVHRLMVQNAIKVDAFGHRLVVGLGFANRSMFSNTFLSSELLPFEPDERFAALGLGAHKLCVTVHRPHWAQLPRDVRIRLVESDDLRRFRDTILIPAWLDGYAHWNAVMADYLLRELDPPTVSRLRARIGDDLTQFLKRHPDFEHRWPSIRAIFPQ
jgi:hypothetical protein